MPWSFRRSFRKNRTSHALRSVIAPRPPRTRLGLTLLEGREVPSAVAVGTEFPAFQTPGALSAPRIAMAPDGRYAVAWEAANGDGSGYGVRYRLFNADGSALTAELPANTATAGDQRRPDVAMDAFGEFVVVWEGVDGEGKGVFGQRFDSSGARLGGEFQANFFWTNEQYEPSVAMGPSGAFVVAFTAYTTAQDGWDVYARRYDYDGTALEAQEFRVNTNAYWSQSGTRAAANADGFVFAYDSYTPESGGSPYSFAQAYTWDGAKRGGEVRLSSNPYHPWGSIVAVGMDAAGNYVTTFNQAYSWDASGWGFYGQRFDPSGNRLGDTFLINTTTAGNQLGLSVAVAPDGSFVTTWQGDSQDGTGANVYAQRFDANGTRLDGEFRVNSTLGGDQQLSQVAVDAYKNPTFVWSGPNGGGTGIYGQQYAIPKPMTSEVATLRPSSNNETMTVTATVSIVGNFYLWEYHVHNNDFRSTWGQPPDALELFFDTTGVTDVSGSGQALGDRIRWTGFEIPADTGEGDPNESDAYFSFRTPVRAWAQMTMFAYGLADGYGASSLVLAPDEQSAPVLGFVTATNRPYVPASEALGVSNFVTTVELPQRVNTTFGLVSFDPENFRIEVVDRTSAAASVNVSLQVLRPPTTGIGPWQPISSDTYSLTHRSTLPQFAGYYRSDFLRLVSDDVDDAVAGEQTIKVQLGDKIEIKYTNAAGQVTIQSIDVGRPVAEDNNDYVPFRHDIREVTVNFVVLKKVGQDAPVLTRAEVEDEVKTIDEVFAQVGVRVKAGYTIDMGADDKGVPLPTTYDNVQLDWTLGFEHDGPKGVAVWSLKKGYKQGNHDPNSIDVFITPNFSKRTEDLDGPRGFSFGPDAVPFYGSGVFRNVVAITADRSAYTLAHEIGHLVMNIRQDHRTPDTSLMSAPVSRTKVVGGTKRIGPYRGSTRAEAMDTSNARQYAEDLP